MLALLAASQRGHTRIGWLDSFHSFSFGDFYDPHRLGFRKLRVINEDRVEPGEGFDTHPHRDMEIISYVLEGALRHRDSTGTGSTIRPGDVQRMSAGTGVLHSEHNASPDEPVHFLQIWIYPDRKNLPPSYEQKHFPEAERRGRFRLVASPDGRESSITIHQDTALYSALLSAGETTSHTLAPGRHAWVQLARGSVTVNGQPLHAGDGLAVSEETRLDVSASEDAEVLLFDLA